MCCLEFCSAEFLPKLQTKENHEKPQTPVSDSTVVSSLLFAVSFSATILSRRCPDAFHLLLFLSMPEGVSAPIPEKYDSQAKLESNGRAIIFSYNK